MEACDLPLVLGQCGIFRQSKYAGERVLPLYLSHSMPRHSAFKMKTGVGLCTCYLNSPIMSLKRVNMDMDSGDLCNVLWNVEAEMLDGQVLYLTGDPVALGCWEPEMAILMSPSSDQSNLWKTEIKVPCGMNFKYNYFIKGDKGLSRDIIWRQGPKFSMSIPLRYKICEKIVVKDLWLRNKIMKVHVPSWGSWLDVTDKTLEPSTKHLGQQACFPGEQARLIGFVDDSFDGKMTIDNILSEAHSYIVNKEDEANNRTSVGDRDLTISGRDLPYEEPWLLHSLLVNGLHVQKEDAKNMGLPNQGFQGIEVGNEEETKVASSEESVSTIILINSSVCTMQRIAVLEDGKLVELLLEPVKNNVQCNSVYLGVITKLVPHMSGAFVDVGISRQSLMEIKPSREPFVYPPFRRRAKYLDINGSEVDVKDHIINESVIGEVNDHENHTLVEDEILGDFMEEDFPDVSEQFCHEEFDDNEAEDAKMSNTLEGNKGVSSVDYGEGEADFEDYFEESGSHMEEESACDTLALEMGSSNDPELSCHIVGRKATDDNTIDRKKWAHVRKGTKVIVQVVKEELGTKGPCLTAYPGLKSRFWVLSTRCDRIGVSKKISGLERTRLRVIAKTLQPPGFGLTVRTVAAGHSLEELQKDLNGLLSTWKDIREHAKCAALAADEGIDGAVPVILHRAMGQTLSVVQDYFNEKVKSMVVDSPRTYHEVTTYLQEIAPDLCDRVKLYDGKIPIFDEYGIEEEINGILSKRVPLSNGGSLVIEQTEALVSIDVNGGHGMLGQGTCQEKAILDVNLAAAKQIARELRLRDIGGIIVVDFIDMVDDAHKRLVYEQMKKAVERDRSMVKVTELSRHGLMEITRKRVRPSVTFMISEPCACCHATGRVVALETSFSKIEREICRLLAMSKQKVDVQNAKSWPKFVLKVDRHMCNYLTSGKRTKLAVLSSSLKVWILLKVARGFPRGVFEVKPFLDDETCRDRAEVAISRLQSAKGASYVQSSKLTVFPVKKSKNNGNFRVFPLGKTGKLVI